MGFPWWLRGKESTCKTEDPGSIHGLGKIPWRRAWQPTPVFLPGKSHRQRSLQSVGSQLDMTERLNTHACMQADGSVLSTLQVDGAKLWYLIAEVYYSVHFQTTIFSTCNGLMGTSLNVSDATVKPQRGKDGAGGVLLWASGSQPWLLTETFQFSSAQSLTHVRLFATP